VHQSLVGLGAGGWCGLGVGNGHNKFAFLPESHTDFVFAVLGEEMGLVGTLAAVVLFLVFAWRGVRIAERAADPFGRLLALGLTVLIFTYAAANMAMTVGLFPVIGVPLPFVSYGGSALVTNLAAVGLLLSIERYGRAHSEWRRRWQRT
jgi:cell division protein FtsW